MRESSSLWRKAKRPQPPAELTLERILKDPLAHRAYDWLVAHEVDREFLTARLIDYPLSNKDRRKPEIVQGLDPRAIGRLPGDLDAMARKLDRVNKSPFISPRVVLWALSKGSHHIEPIAKWVKEGTTLRKVVNFEWLPFILRELAEYVRAWLLIHPEAKRLGLLLTQRQAEQLRLLVHVARQTGSPRFGRVATLLIAALREAEVSVGGITAVPNLCRQLKTLWKDKRFARQILAAEAPKAVPVPQAVVNVEATSAPTPEVLPPAE